MNTKPKKRVRRLWVSVSEGCGEPGNCRVEVSIYRSRTWARLDHYPEMDGMCAEGFERITGIKVRAGEIFPVVLRRAK